MALVIGKKMIFSLLSLDFVPLDMIINVPLDMIINAVKVNIVNGSHLSICCSCFGLYLFIF